MKVQLVAPPWGIPTMTSEMEEAVGLLGDNVWREASVRFFAERDASIRAGKTAPKGMQRYLNAVIEEKMINHAWEGGGGTFIKDKTWVRVTFRHQMSLGSDFLNALKVCKREGVELAAIIASDAKTLKVITPNDCGAIVSFEKLLGEANSLYGAMDIPLLLGKMTPITNTSDLIEAELRKSRPRDRSMPQATPA